jgi:hypothetical protein
VSRACREWLAAVGLEFLTAPGSLGRTGVPLRWVTLARMDTVAVIVLVFLALLPAVLVGGLFVWAALKDGQEDRALQARLGIRRRTRLGR